MKPSSRKVKSLQLLSAIGFTGKVVGGLNVQSEDRGLVYPVGVGVGVWDRSGGHHAILHAHTRPVTALTVSRSGRLIVSAQNSDPGCQAVVVVWRYKEREELGRHKVHREEVSAVAVSSGEEYVVSLGGELDGYLVVWHVDTRRPLCSVQAGEPGLGTASLLCTAPCTPTLMVVGGHRLLRTWTLHPDTHRLTPTPTSLGLLERNYTCLQVDEAEEFLYAATSSGDVVKVRLNSGQGEGCWSVLVSVMAPRPHHAHNRLSRHPAPGIQALVLLGGDLLLAGDVGGGVRAYRQLQEEVRRPTCPGPPRAHGTLKYTHPKDPTRPLLQQLWCVEVGAAVTSLSVVGQEVVVGTIASEIYTFRLSSKQVPLTSTTHVRFNTGKQKRAVTAVSEEGGVVKRREVNTYWNSVLLRCYSGVILVAVGWSDGRLRGLGAESGRVLWVVDDAHHAGVNAVVTLPSGTIISGGRDGRVRVWEVNGGVGGVRMVTSQKEHRGEVTHLTLTQAQDHVLSCSGDGSCVLWRLPQLERVKRLRAHTVFLGGVVLRCGEVVTAGSDGAVMVWDRLDGTLLADLPSSQQPITCLAVTKDDSTLVTAGEDAVVRVWNWKKGRVTHEGRGHSGAITRVAISPDARLLATAGKDGALLFWKLQ
ncbi:hypothetical protein Pcinc_043066 [Petrolisthes cinctipes]|uniref:Cilia- and flagella-associated protein 52 n=1 Tax=Petrolisthes cinctipes TaxID=88211 RepID=A0AAE1EFC5_PETCI|nr:hypothetical protein Pcinc_043066 [Petrolisthes cinctipes]